MSEISILAIDLAKNSFQVCGALLQKLLLRRGSPFPR